MQAKKCLKCNKEFTKKMFESKSFWETRKYCSHSCANSVNSIGRKSCVGRTPWNKGLKGFTAGENNPKYSRIKKSCLECGKEFEIRKYRENTAKFCSHNCEHSARDEGKTPAYNRIRKSASYREWRKAVFERDDYACQDCGQRGGKLHADHIQPFALFPELRLNINNGRTLCIDCHKKTPTYGYRGKNCVAVSQEV